jgi:hypothetical protein
MREVQRLCGEFLPFARAFPFDSAAIIDFPSHTKTAT